MANPTSTGYMLYQPTGADGTKCAIGGDVILFTAGGTLNVGDSVFLSADKTVIKGLGTASSRITTIGIVVGGKRTAGEAVMTDLTTAAILAGVQAAQVNEDVLVLVRGVAYVVTDSAITVGSAITLSSATSGRVGGAAVFTIAAGATPVTSSAANGAIISGEGVNRNIGKLLEASTGAGQVKLAYIAVNG